ncbi:asparagine synthase (glutamine-hydrolysing) [Gammaproteobacteria bacterium]
MSIVCGIAGFIGDWVDSSTILQRMTAAIAHRGPDAEGFYQHGPVHLGHRRLAVIDLDSGRQPLFNEDGQIVVVFNGEIYNFIELRTELIACGHQFVTHTDSEVLVHGYEEYGDTLLEKLRGMFSFALWDEKRQRLLVARDHLGVKPLHYYWAHGQFIFASEIKAMHEHPAVVHELDLNSLGLFLECQYIPAPHSIYCDILKLPAGHALIIENGKLTLFSYWHIDYSHKLILNEEDAADLVEKTLRDSIRAMLVADVSIGAFLSGGVDSSLIAALMAQEASGQIRTFNLGFSGEVAGSEHEYAHRVAEHIASEHHSLILAPMDVLAAFSGWIDIFDEPFADQAALPTLLLSRFARQKVTVVLTGEGADEVFAGYGNYYKRLREERLSALFGHPYSPLPALLRHLPAMARKDRMLKAITEPVARRYATIPMLFDTLLGKNLYTPNFLAGQKERIVDYGERFYRECNSNNYLDHLLHIDLRLWLADDLLTKVDRATMECALEARVPYLDHHFVELCARLSPHLKCRGKTGKYLLKKIAERHLPAKIVYRDKHGFVMPLSEWLANELKPTVRQCLRDLATRGLFLPEALCRIEGEHYTGKRNHAGRLWALLVLEQWFQRFQPEFTLAA